MAKNRSKSKNRNVTPKQIVSPESNNQTSEGAPEELPRDILDDFLFHAANYIYVRKKLFIALSTGLVIILLAIYGGFRYLRYQENIRNEKLFQVESIINNQSLEKSEIYDQAKPLLDEFIQTYAGSAQEPIALVRRAEISYQTQHYAEAEADLNAVFSMEDEDSDLKTLTGIYLSNVLRDQNKSEQAIDVLNSLNAGKLGDVVLMELAETYVMLDKNEDAKNTLQILLKDHPNSGFSQKAKEMIDLL